LSDGQHTLTIGLKLQDAEFTGKLNAGSKVAQDFEKSWNRTKASLGDDKPVKHAVGSVDDLTERLRQAKKEFNALPASHAKYGSSLKRVQVLQDHLRSSTSRSLGSLSKFGAASGNAGSAVLDMNRIVSDAPWGFTAISNNIEPAIQSMMRLSATSGGLKGALKTLGSSMMGPLGLMTAVSLATAAMTYFSLRSRGAKEKTSSLKTEVVDLNEKVRMLAASYEDVVEAQKKNRTLLMGVNIKEQESLIATYQSKINRGGIVSKGEWQPYSAQQIAGFNQAIDAAKEKIIQYNNELEHGNEFTQENIRLLKELSNTALKDGAAGLDKFKKANQLTNAQMANLIAQLKYIENSVMTIGGGLGKNLPEGTRTLAAELKIQRDDLVKTIEVLDKYTGKLKGEAAGGKETPARSINLDMRNVEAKGIQLTGKQKEIYESIEKQFREVGAEFNTASQTWAIKISLTYAAAPGKRELEDQIRTELYEKRYGLMEPKNNKFEKPEVINENKLASESFNLVGQVATLAGDRIADAMFEGKLSVNQLTNEINRLIVKLALVEGLKYVLSGGTSGMFASFRTGGISTRPKEFAFVNPKVFAGAPHFASGGIAGIPAILHKREMILTEKDQLNLMNFIRGSRSGTNGQTIVVQPIFENVLEEQKLIYRGLKKRQSRRR